MKDYFYSVIATAILAYFLGFTYNPAFIGTHWAQVVKAYQTEIVKP